MSIKYWCRFVDVNEDECEEGFVEQTDYTTVTNNYRVGRVKFSIVEDELDPIEMEKCLNECYGSKNQTLAGDFDDENRTPREIIQHSCLIDVKALNL
ncbi:unnamed protein product [Rotaria magnacalcarata]|nr:unnamed protein product [Rotaria magnacalcarata]CAF2197016.1 unnamed protein product [Rotaria magnacalcarata]